MDLIVHVKYKHYVYSIPGWLNSQMNKAAGVKAWLYVVYIYSISKSWMVITVCP